MLIYGVCISDIKAINEDRALELLKKYSAVNPDPYNNYLESKDADGEQVTFDTWCYDYENNGHFGLSALLSDIIQDLEGIDIVCDDPNGIHFLGISADVPWHYNQKTRSLSHEEYQRIMAEYISQITDEILPLRWWHVQDDCGY